MEHAGSGGECLLLHTNSFVPLDVFSFSEPAITVGTLLFERSGLRTLCHSQRLTYFLKMAVSCQKAHLDLIWFPFLRNHAS